MAKVLIKELEPYRPLFIEEPVLAEQMKDVIEYRAMDYYRRRYKEQIKALL